MIWRDIAVDLMIVGSAIMPHRGSSPLLGELVDVLSSLAQVTLQLHHEASRASRENPHAGVPSAVEQATDSGNPIWD